MEEKVIHEVRIVETEDGYRIEIKGDKERLKEMFSGRGWGPFSFARMMRDCDADEIPISHNAARRIEVDPAGARHVDLHPGVHVAALDNIVVVIVGQMHVSRDEPRRNSACP